MAWYTTMIVSLRFHFYSIHNSYTRAQNTVITQNNWTRLEHRLWLEHHWKPEVFITHTHTLHYIIIKHGAVVKCFNITHINYGVIGAVLLIKRNMRYFWISVFTNIAGCFRIFIMYKGDLFIVLLWAAFATGLRICCVAVVYLWLRADLSICPLIVSGLLILLAVICS